MRVLEAPGKVNLCLFLGPVRPGDGRHELVTVFQSLSLSDRLTVGPADRDEVICPGVDGENLAWRALRGLRELGFGGPPLRIAIEKRIPVAAGMAGGSADAAAVLRVALGELGEGELVSLAASLGADVPAQLDPGLTLGTGAGEIIEPLSPLAHHAWLIVPAPVALSTPAVFREADRLGLPREDLPAWEAQVRAALAAGGRFPDELVVNDLQAAAVSLIPSLRDVLAEVERTGADHALVSGSGPTVVGLRWGSEAGAWATAAAEGLRARFPGTTAALPIIRADPAGRPELSSQ